MKYREKGMDISITVCAVVEGMGTRYPVMHFEGTGDGRPFEGELGIDVEILNEVMPVDAMPGSPDEADQADIITAVRASEVFKQAIEAYRHPTMETMHNILQKINEVARKPNGKKNLPYYLLDLGLTLGSMRRVTENGRAFSEFTVIRVSDKTEYMKFRLGDNIRMN